MVGTSKILTVSYGTFSCTLEGFDDPFGTMRLIAEYFRDLAAEDRYFGAEPPVPDAEMLHRIAEREVQKRVIARVGDTGVVLRQVEEEDEDAPEAPPSVLPAPDPAQKRKKDKAEVKAKAKARVLADDQPSPAPRPAPAPADNLASRLGRLRAAVARSASPAGYLEDQHSDEFFTFRPIAAAFADVKDAEEVHDDDAAVPAPAARVAPESVRSLPEAPDEDADEAEASALSSAAAKAAPAAEEPAEDEDEPDLAALVARVAMAAGADEQVAAPVMEQASEPVPAEGALRPDDHEPPTWAEDETEAVDTLDHVERLDAATVPPVTETGDAAMASAQGEAPEAHEVEAVVPAEDSASAAEPEPLPERSHPARPVGAARLVRARVIKMKRTDVTPSEVPVPEAEAAPVAAAREPLEALVAKLAAVEDAPEEARQEPANLLVLDDAYRADAEDEVDNFFAATETVGDQSRDWDDDADHDALPVPAEAVEDVATRASLAAGTLPDEAEADLLEELAAVERDATEVRRSGRSLFDTRAGDEGFSVTRILAETNSQLDDTEASRRRSTIAHLKAAVAATRAGIAPDKAETTENIDRFRDDLERMVRPRRPGEVRPSGTARRLAPLMLVSEQRIDLPKSDPATETAVRPRRVTTGNLALVDEDEAEEADLDAGQALISDTTSFGEYVEQLGVTELTDLLEAAAAYSAYVEGLPHFTRPQLMKLVTAFAEGFSREDGLRAFGVLLRQGRIQKLKRGQFAIAKNSRFRPQGAA